VRALAAPDVVLLGQVPDLTDLYNSARAFIAPHRYAGGIPTKILEAAAHGLPCVAGELLRRQLGWRDGVELQSAANASGFAAAVLRLYSDELLWSAIRIAALTALEQNFSERGFDLALGTALQAVWKRNESGT